MLVGHRPIAFVASFLFEYFMVENFTITVYPNQVHFIDMSLKIWYQATFKQESEY